MSLISGERRRFENAIIEAKGDRNQAAQILGLSRATFFRKAKDLGLVKGRRTLYCLLILFLNQNQGSQCQLNIYILSISYDNDH